MFSKNAADLADKTSRITYHVKLIHLLAACCENSNESTARKIRILVPLTFAAAVILHADTPTKIRTAYYRIVDSLYVEPVAVQPSLAFDIYARFVGTNPAGDVHEAHLKVPTCPNFHVSRCHATACYRLLTVLYTCSRWAVCCKNL